MGIICAVANQKGGVGKTTTAINLGSALAERDQRVLLVDVDPQANATSAMGVGRDRASLYEVLAGTATITQVTVGTNQVKLDLLPSSLALVGAEVELVAMNRRETVLRRCLNPIRGIYDIILLDCPPSLALLTLNALTASDAVIVPVQCEYLALEGLERLMSTIRLVQAELNPNLQVMGVLPTMFDARTNLAQQVVDELGRFFEDQVFKTIVPRSVRLAEAPSYGQSILRYAPESRGAQAYRALAQEVLERTARLWLKRR